MLNAKPKRGVVYSRNRRATARAIGTCHGIRHYKLIHVVLVYQVGTGRLSLRCALRIIGRGAPKPKENKRKRKPLFLRIFEISRCYLLGEIALLLGPSCFMQRNGQKRQKNNLYKNVYGVLELSLFLVEKRTKKDIHKSVCVVLELSLLRNAHKRPLKKVPTSFTK
jgi:hypothetical protein